jgi:hypothetical protein
LDFAPQVLPDYHGAKCKNNDGLHLTDQSLLEYRARADEAMGCRIESSKFRRQAPTLKEKYQANIDVGMAFDNACRRSFNAESLNLFVPELAPCALPKGSERVLVDVEHLPVEIQELSPGRQHRSFIIDKDGDTRLECAWGPTRRSLFADIDRGSIGFHHKILMFYEWGLRGDFIPDICHIRHRGVLRAYSEAGLDVAKLELSIVMNVLRYPPHFL